MSIETIVQAQREYFATGATLPVTLRKEALIRLQAEIRRREDILCEAMRQDLNKSHYESYMCEIGLVLDELGHTIRKMEKWARPKRAATPLAQFSARSYMMKEPYGLALVMAPWNYPFLLSMDPVIGAIAAGNCVVLKPSAYAPATSRAMAELIAAVFDPRWVAVVEGGRKENSALLDQKFDYIFFTGGVTVGKLVMEKASQHLTPVTLELGGKSPVIVDETADIPLTARRLAFGKVLNAGQTCVAPDYLFVHKDVKEVLIKKMINCVERFYGKNMQKSRCYCRIINDKAFQRLLSYLSDGQVIYGGKYDAADRYMQFTLLDNVAADAAIMRDEIFGPLLPVMTFDDIKEVISFVNGRPKPLALYYFGSDDAAKEVLSQTTSGGACINDTVLHVANGHLPFGGVGNSGMGKYHSYYSFIAFSNIRSVLKSSNMIDFTIKYPPYNNFGLVDKLM